MTGFRESLRQFFRSQRLQLLAAATEADTPHSGLLGAHREALVRDFLGSLLPRRFSAGRGIVFGFAHTSRESDVVLWDSDNYPCVRLRDYSHFFAESVRVVLEAKSRYSAAELEDLLEKCRAIRDIVPLPGANLADAIAMLEVEVISLRDGIPHGGMVMARHHIASAGFFFFGGQTFSLEDLDPAVAKRLDDAWPDVVVFLDAGLVVVKRYERADVAFGGHGYLELVRAGEDSLMAFAAFLMTLISERSVQVEDPSFLEQHLVLREFGFPVTERAFSLTRPVAGRTPLWRRSNDV